jgi:hypothetical protein
MGGGSQVGGSVLHEVIHGNRKVMGTSSDGLRYVCMAGLSFAWAFLLWTARRQHAIICRFFRQQKNAFHINL